MRISLRVLPSGRTEEGMWRVPEGVVMMPDVVPLEGDVVGVGIMAVLVVALTRYRPSKEGCQVPAFESKVGIY